MTMWNRDLLKSDKIVLVNEALMQKDKDGSIKMNPQMKKIFVQLGRDKLPEEKHYGKSIIQQLGRKKLFNH